MKEEYVLVACHKGIYGSRSSGILADNCCLILAVYPPMYPLDGIESSDGVHALLEQYQSPDEFFGELGIDCVEDNGIWVIEIEKSDNELGGGWSHLSIKTIRRPDEEEWKRIKENKCAWEGGVML